MFFDFYVTLPNSLGFSPHSLFSPARQPLTRDEVNTFTVPHTQPAQSCVPLVQSPAVPLALCSFRVGQRFQPPHLNTGVYVLFFTFFFTGTRNAPSFQTFFPISSAILDGVLLCSREFPRMVFCFSFTPTCLKPQVILLFSFFFYDLSFVLLLCPVISGGGSISLLPSNPV